MTLASHEKATHPKCEFTKEVRLALVMYGGVSLAIYINGVSREFFNLARATAPENGNNVRALFADEQLSSTDKVYRKLGRLLGGDTAQGITGSENGPLRAKFVVDIISGTSAGGINGLFLAKALANNQDFGKLKDLWLMEGDIELLINDKQSAKGLFPSPQVPPRSLLDSRRMYRKLLDALHGMELTAAEGVPSLAEEVDLFMTTTDLSGVTLPIRLADALVYERRHKSVFRFSYRSRERSDDDKEMNDFRKRNNPFLAFAARCTSSFPFAFEPMRLADIDEVLDSLPYPDYRGPGYRSDSPEWRPYLRDYPADDKTDIPLHERSFGDGGYLDNKPFTYVTQALLRRQADLPVKRMLFYVEPSPEHPEDKKDRREKPDVLENVMDALVTLPRYETIREDLNAILDRNRLIARIQRMISGFESDTDFSRTSRERQDGRLWALSANLRSLTRERGPAYGGYHRLKVGAVSEDLAEIIARVAGVGRDSDRFSSINYLVRAWRSLRYPSDAKPPLEGEYMFLVRFDLSFRIRRLNLVRSRIDHLLAASANEVASIGERLKIQSGNVTGNNVDLFRKALLRLKQEMNLAFRDLLAAKRTLWSRHKNPLSEILQSINIGMSELSEIMAPATEGDRLAAAEKVVQKYGKLFDAFGEKLDELIKERTMQASDRSKLAFGIVENVAGSEEVLAREFVRHYYSCFEDYDMVIFPVMYCSEIGEPDMVDIFRISPEDAKSLIDERGGDGRKKLGGTAFANFGAFLDRLWRENDIMWGRLDGAERLISALLPEQKDRATREALIEEAQDIIIGEELKLEDRRKLCDLLSKAIEEEGEKLTDAKELLKMIREKTGADIHDRVVSVLRGCLTPAQVKDYLKKDYEVRRQLDMNKMVKTLSRATIVVQKMLDDLARGRGVGARGMVWVARLARIVWGFFLVLIPNSLASILLHHWGKLIAVFALLTVIGGFMFSKTHMWIGLGVLALEGIILGLIGAFRKSLGLK